MARPKSPARTLRRDIKARERNKSQLRTMKTIMKKCKLSSKSETPDQLLKRQTQSLLDRAARKNLIHPNKAARLKSSIMSRKVVAEAR